MINILLVEDNKEISENIVRYFNNVVKIDTVYNGEDAIDLLNVYNYDIVVLDLMLPEIDGMGVLSYISKKHLNAGVIILTAKEDLEDKLKAFDIGAHDYLTKPFFMEELKARINVILKTMGKIKKPNILEFKDLVIDMKTKSIKIGSKKLDFNEKLYNLIEYLVINKGVLLFKEQIFDRVCGYNSDASTDIVEVYMSRLRKQLREFGYDKYIITKRGMGYILDESIEE